MNSLSDVARIKKQIDAEAEAALLALVWSVWVGCMKNSKVSSVMKLINI